MASGTSHRHVTKYPIFKTSIDKLFGNWQALQLAIENGQGGSYGKQIAQWMREVVEEFFYQNDDLDGDEVSDYIGTIMNQELDTVVDDNSLEPLGQALVHHFRLASTGKHSELQELFQKLDEEAAKPKPKAAKGDDNESDEDSDEDGGGDEDMEVDEPPPSGQGESPQQESSSQHRAGKNYVTEADDDGWVTVTKSKKH